MYNVGIAYLLWFLSGFGAAGFHRFYLGKIPSGILWMFTGGLFGIGSIYDLVTLSRQVQEANIRKAIYSRTDINIGDYGHIHNAAINGAHGKRDKESIERIILREAKDNKGVITPSGVAYAGNISIEESKKYLDALVSKGFAELRVRKTGGIVYAIPDIMDSNEPLEDI